MIDIYLQIGSETGTFIIIIIANNTIFILLSLLFDVAARIEIRDLVNLT